MIDVLFSAKNRFEFTRASFRALVANTDWSLVNALTVFDDGSTDGTFEWLHGYVSGDIGRRLPCSLSVVSTRHGAPAAIMKDFVANYSASDLFAKIDNDVIVPPGWLAACADVMACSPELDLLGIEPPESRTPRSAGGARSKCPEHDASQMDMYAPCDSIGGIGLMRRRVFVEHAGALRPHSTYGGFTEMQVATPSIVKGWITPPLRVFLLDRLPTEPWAALSRRYIAAGWQRAWSNYDPATPFWDWWEPTT